MRDGEWGGQLPLTAGSVEAETSDVADANLYLLESAAAFPELGQKVITALPKSQRYCLW
jgi:hypothetical protein